MTGSSARSAILIAALTVGCATGDTRISESELRPVPVPDVSSASGAVQRQLRDRHAELTRIADSADASADTRGAAYGELGKLFLAAHLFQAAEPALMNAHRLTPREPRWPYYLGHLRRMTGDPDTAATFFQQTLQLDPNQTAARVWLGRMYLDSGRADVAAAEFARVQDVAGAQFAARVGLGRAALLAGDYASAVRHLEGALTLDPNGSIAEYPLATAYRALGDTNRADAHLRRRGDGEQELPDPWMDEVSEALDSPITLQRRGMRALYAGAFDDAATQFRKALQSDPPPLVRLSLMQKLATALFFAHDEAAAIEQLQAGIRLDATYAPNHYTLGLIFDSRGDVVQAETQFAEAVKDDPNYVEARLALGNVLRRTGRARAALSHLERAIALAPRSAESRYEYAVALVDAGRPAEARSQLALGRDAFPDDRRFTEELTRLETR
jgi:tetratricopeptide (TPR) repeat protein